MDFDQIDEEEEISAIEEAGPPDQTWGRTMERGPRKRKSRSATPINVRRKRGELSKEEKKQGPKLFQDVWLQAEQFKGWLEKVPGKPHKARCKLCLKEMGAGKSELEKHGEGIKHQALVKAAKAVQPINQIFMPARLSKEEQLVRDVKTAEIRLSTLFIQHNIALQVSDHLVDLLKATVHDSEIVKKMSLDRTKCTSIVQNVVSKVEKERIIKDLKQVKFSVLIDESTDVSNKKNMVVLTKYTCPQTGKILCPLLDIIELDAKDTTAEALWQAFKGLLDGFGIPLTNIVGLASDHAPVMLGKNNSFMTRMKAEIPWLVVLDCNCHSSHIAASTACRKLPPLVSGTVKRLSTYTSGSPKRCAILEEFQAFFMEQTSRLLRPVLTRWLILQPCAVRVLDNLPTLKEFLQYCVFEDRKDTEASALLRDIRNPFFKVYLLFLKYALEYFNQMNALFQSEKTLVHHLQSASRRLLRQVCQNYMRGNVLDSFHKIDVAHPHFQVALEKVYLGPGVEEALAAVPLPDNPDGKLTPEELNAQRSNDIKAVRLACLDFYITAAKQLQLYLPLNSPIIREAAFIDPAVAISSRARQKDLPELRALSENFRVCLALDTEAMAREWRNMPSDVPQESHERLSKLQPQEFWNEAAQMKDFRDEPIFPNLVRLAEVVMAFPHSNAEAERVFSHVADIKNKKRNRMGNETLDAICVTRTQMRQRDEPCFKYNETADHLQLHNKNMYAHHNKKQ